MCFQENFSQKMDRRIWETALLPVYPHVELVLIQGGEPTILKESKDLVALVSNINPTARFGMMTNGLRFDDYWQQTFAEKGYEVNFSINAATKETHEIINKGSKFDVVCSNLTRLTELRRERGASLDIRLSFVIIPENVHEIADFVEFGKQHGVDVRFFFDATRMPVENQRVEEEVARAFELKRSYRDVMDVLGLSTFYNYYCHHRGVENRFADEREAAAEKCNAPWQGLNVDRNGLVQFCCMSNLILGDLNKATIEDVWNNRRARAFRKRMAEGDFRYCQPDCSLNTNPNYTFDLVKSQYYLSRFISEFRSSPSVAYKKAMRKLKLYV
jgi:MoaA/NifB/PqqE/SkfB family radical SAM enzyme